MDRKLIRKYEKAIAMNDRGTKLRIISKEEMMETIEINYDEEEKRIAKQSRLDGIANLHEEQALKIHMEEANAINDKTNQRKAVA
tara:strand:+ start:18 stop:272 length:255 start_codon:yes stop_codon:yes gene_type:complete